MVVVNNRVQLMLVCCASLLASYRGSASMVGVFYWGLKCEHEVFDIANRFMSLLLLLFG